MIKKSNGLNGVGAVIKSTTDYSIFKNKEGNRTPIKKSVNRLALSIQKNNLLSVNPIIVNTKMEVIDGQHRLLAAKILGLPIYYVVFDPASLSEIQLLNANMKAWSALDFLRSYIAQGKEEYISFDKFYKENKLPFTNTLIILSLSKDNKLPARPHTKFREGEFVIEDIDHAQRIVDTMREIATYADPACLTNRLFYASLFYLIVKKPTYIPLLRAKLKEGHSIHRQPTRADYLLIFEQIINKGNYGKIKHL